MLPSPTIRKHTHYLSNKKELRPPAASRRPGLSRSKTPALSYNGQQLPYFYFEEERGRQSGAKLLTKDEAWRIAAGIAKLPELLRP
jgi:hypothetical protein